MKDFFKSIWTWIVNAFKTLLQWLLGAYDWFVGLLNKIRRDRLYHFIAGLIFAVIAALVFHIEWAIVPVFFIGFIKEFIDLWRDGNFDWIDLLATVLGGAIVWICQLIGG